MVNSQRVVSLITNKLNIGMAPSIMTTWDISFFVSSGGFMKEYKSVTLSKFLSRFLAVDGMALTKLSHADVKMLFPMLKRASFEYVEKHPEEVMMGRIFMVNDCK